MTKAPKDAPAAAPRGNGRGQDWKRLTISAFLLFHLIAIASWALPFNSLLNDRTKEVIRPYMLWSGLFQIWDMFAPDPLKMNSYVDAEVWFRDGSARVWSLPRMNEIGLVERYFKERYRKFSEYLRRDSHSVFWPDAARYIARLHRNPGNPPTAVQLIRHWSDINPPGPGGQYQPGRWQQYLYYTYLVQPGDLE